jgi:hypothetical protein
VRTYAARMSGPFRDLLLPGSEPNQVVNPNGPVKRNPLRNNTLFFSQRKSLSGNYLLSSRPFRSLSKRKEPVSNLAEFG